MAASFPTGAGTGVMLPAHYAIEGVCAACRRAIKAHSARYRVGDSEYHADCFDISLFASDQRPSPITNDSTDADTTP